MEIENIEKLITKVKATISQHKTVYSDGRFEMLDLTLRTSLIGGSVNSVSQLLEIKLSEFEINEIINAKQKIERIILELKNTIDFDDKKVKKITKHKFH